MRALLARQLRRHLGPGVEIPPEWTSLLAAVTLAYQQADDDRAMLEHSLDTVSREMLERHHRLEQQKARHASLVAEKRRAEELALLNAVQIAALRATTPTEAIVDVLDQVATLSGAAGGVASRRRGGVGVARVPASDVQRPTCEWGAGVPSLVRSAPTACGCASWALSLPERRADRSWIVLMHALIGAMQASVPESFVATNQPGRRRAACPLP